MGQLIVPFEEQKFLRKSKYSCGWCPKSLIVTKDNMTRRILPGDLGCYLWR
jgi:hypothetical protein